MLKIRRKYICLIVFFTTLIGYSQGDIENTQTCPNCSYFSIQTTQAETKSINSLNTAQMAGQQALNASNTASLAQTAANALNQAQAQNAANQALAQAQAAQLQVQAALAYAQELKNQVLAAQAANATIQANQGQATAAQAAAIQTAVANANIAQAKADAAAAAAQSAAQLASQAASQAAGINSNSAQNINSGIVTGPVVTYPLIPRASPPETTANSSTSGTPFMVAIKLYNKQALTLDEAYKVIRHYIDIVIPDVANGRKQFMQNVVSKVANGLPDNQKANAESILAEYMRSNTLQIHPEVSAKSPCNVDISKVTPKGPNDPDFLYQTRFMNVYGELMKSPKFKELFIDMFNDSSKPRVRFEIGDTRNNAAGETLIFPNNPMDNRIIISRTLLQTGNAMLIAKTIIHECIHAYLNIKLCDPTIGMDIPSINNMDVQMVINTYYNGFRPGTQDQHDFIYNFMLPTMHTILSEVKDLLVTPTQNSGMLTLTMHIPEGASGTPFNWTDAYINLSLSGLQNCNFFKNEIATFDTQGNIQTTVNSSKTASFIQYNNYLKNYLNNN